MPRWAYDLENRLNTLAKTTGARIVSELSDRIAQVQQDLSELSTELDQEIQQVKDAIAAGSVTAEDLAGLDDISSRVKGFTTSLAADDPAAPPAPTA